MRAKNLIGEGEFFSIRAEGMTSLALAVGHGLLQRRHPRIAGVGSLTPIAKVAAILYILLNC